MISNRTAILKIENRRLFFYKSRSIKGRIIRIKIATIRVILRDTERISNLCDLRKMYFYKVGTSFFERIKIK